MAVLQGLKFLLYITAQELWVGKPFETSPDGRPLQFASDIADHFLHSKLQIAQKLWAS